MLILETGVPEDLLNHLGLDAILKEECSTGMRNYITEIFSKLQVADRAQATIRACNGGLAYWDR